MIGFTFDMVHPKIFLHSRNQCKRSTSGYVACAIDVRYPYGWLTYADPLAGGAASKRDWTSDRRMHQNPLVHCL